MNRRKFLAASWAATAAGVLIADLPHKTFFLPPAGGWRQDLPIVYGAFGGGSLDGLYSTARIRVKPGLLHMHDLLSVNGGLYRVASLIWPVGIAGANYVDVGLVTA